MRPDSHRLVALDGAVILAVSVAICLASQRLLFMTFLVPFFVPLPFYGLEVFVGFMQAFVFAFLTLIFMSMAVVGHGHDGEHH